MRYFRLTDDLTIPNRWYLASPHVRQGSELDPRCFTQGQPIDVAGILELPLRRSGRALDFTLADFDMPVVTRTLGAQLDVLAPGYVQRFPVNIPGASKAYEILNVTATLDCLDEARTELMRWRSEDGRPDKIGQYRMVTNIVLAMPCVGAQPLFRLGGWRVALLCSEVIVNGLAHVPHLGLRFEEVGVSPGVPAA